MRTYYPLLRLTTAISALSIILCTACTEKKIPVDDPAARVGDHWLSQTEVRRNLPVGITGQDSLKAANAFINNWVENEAIMLVAERNIPDTKEIDRLVEDYRRELLMWEYRRRKIDENITDPVITPQQISDYITSHIQDYTLDSPIIKGIYIKISDDDPVLDEVRRLYKSDRTDDIDKLDKLVGSAVNYEYFRDQWMNWQQIADRIPFDGFESNPDSYPVNQKNLDHNFDGYVYLLHITDVMKPGNPMPESYAEPFVIEAIRRENALEYDKTLRQLLTSDALTDGTAQIF